MDTAPDEQAAGIVETADEAAEAVARRSYARLLALLAARTRDVAGAEDVLADAFAAALVTWRVQGVPRSPEAWLLTVAWRRWIDAARRRRSAEDARAELRRRAAERQAAAGASPVRECLALLYVCAHPALDPDVRAPLVLQTLLGFDTASLAEAFHVAPATLAQRLVRAKRRIRDAGIPLELRETPGLGPRLDAVLETLSQVCG